MSRDNLIYSKQSGVALLEINRPDTGNRIDPSLALEMRELLVDISLDSDIKVLVLTGKGDEFCSGDDISMIDLASGCLLYTSPSPRDQRGSRMPSSA